MYIDDGVFSISVEIEDSYGNSSSATVPFTSVNSAPVVSSINSYSWYGTMVMLDIPSFVDLGLNDTHYAILDWGNGATSTADVTLTLPSATDTLVGKDTTDILANKTLRAGKFIFNDFFHVKKTRKVVPGSDFGL